MSVYDYMDEGDQRVPVVSPLRRDASFKPAQVQELEASLADHSSPFEKAFKQSLATDTAGKIQRDLLEARVAGDARAEYNALDNLRDSSLRRQQIGTVGSTSWGDASEKGDWGNYLQNTLGGAAGSMLKPALASAAGGALGVAPAAVASYLGSKSAINNAELDRYAGDKELSALSPQEQLDLANKSASLQAVPEAILPFYHGIGGKLPGALSRVPKSGRVVGEVLGEGATEGLQSYIGQRVDQTVLPDREIDWNDIKENAIGGAIAGGAFSLAGNHTVEDISGGKRPGDNGGVANIDPAPPGTPLLGGPPSASDRMVNAWEGFKNSEAGGKVEDMFASAMGMAEAAKARFDEGGVSGAANAAANKAFDAFGAAKEAFDRAAASSQVEAANAAAKEMAAAAKSAYESLTGSPLAQAAKERIENADFGGAANNAKNSAFDKIGELASAAKDRYGDRTKSGLDRAKGTLDTVLDRTTEAVKNAKNPSEFLQMVFKGDISEEAENDLNAQDDSALVGATPEETGANMDRDTRRREERAAKFAQALLEDPATPDSVRQRVAEMGGDFSDKGNRDYVARALVSQRAGARAANAAHSLVDLGKRVFGKGAGMVSGALEAAADRIVKKNLQSATPHEQVAFGRIIFDELTDAAKADPVVRRQLSDITNYLVAFAAKTGDITAKDLPVLTRLSDALSMFKDPDAMVQKLVDYVGVERDKTSFVSRIRSVTSAEQDLKTPNSFLVSSLSPQIRDEALGSQAAMRRIAQLVDGFSTNGTKAAEDRVLQALAPVFGSEENALVVLDYYSKQNKANLLFDPNEMDEPAMSGELDAGETMDDGVSYKDRTINEEDASALEPRFRNANTNRPFFVGRDDKALAEIAKDGRTGSMLDYVNATNANAKLTVYDIRRDLKKRLEGHTARDTESVQTLLKELETRLGDPKGFESAKDRADAVMLRTKLREVKTEDRSQVVRPLREELRAQDDAIAAAKEAGKDPYEAVLRLYNTTLGKPDESEASDRQMTAFRELLDKEGADEKKNEDIRKTVISVKLDGKKVNLSLQSMVKHSPEHGSIKNRLLASLALVAARTGEVPTIAPDTVVKLNHLGPGRHLTWGRLVGLRRNFHTKELFDKGSPEKLAKKDALDKITAGNLRKYIDSLPREMDGLDVAKGLLGRVERALKAAVDKMDAEGDGWARTRLAKEIGELGSKKRVLRSYLREIMEADYPVNKETILEAISFEKEKSQDTGSDETEYLNILATEAQIEAYRDRARALAGTSLEEENVKEAETLVDELDRLLNSMPPHMRMTLEDRPSGRRTPESLSREHIKTSVPSANVGVGESPESYGRNMPAFKYAIRNAVGEQADTVVVAVSNLNSALQTAGLSDITKADLRLGGDPSGPAGFVHNGKIYLAANNIAVGGVDAAIVSSLGTNRLSTREVLGKDVAERLEKEVASWAEAPDVNDERAILFGSFGDQTVTMEKAADSAMSSLGLRPRAKGSRRGVGAETAQSFANEAIAKLTNSSGGGQFSLQDLVDVAHYVSSETLKNPSALGRVLNARTADTTANSGAREKTEPTNTKPTGSKNPAASSRGVAEAVNNHRALSDSALSALHDVVVNENYDRLNTPDKVLRFASMAKQALEQILSIPEMDRTEQQDDLRYKLNGLFKRGAVEFDWDSLWDGLEPTEEQRTKLKDITSPKAEPGEPGQRVVLPGSGAFIAKDQAKSDRANKFIGRGVAGSSTARYAAAWGARANTGVYAPSDVVFVSSNGNRAGRVKPDFVEIGKAVKAGATIIGDTAFHRGREFNIGEREVAAFLEKNNYVERDDGEWVPSQGLVTPEDKQSTMGPTGGDIVSEIEERAYAAAVKAAKEKYGSDVDTTRVFDADEGLNAVYEKAIADADAKSGGAYTRAKNAQEQENSEAVASNKAKLKEAYAARSQAERKATMRGRRSDQSVVQEYQRINDKVVREAYEMTEGQLRDAIQRTQKRYDSMPERTYKHGVDPRSFVAMDLDSLNRVYRERFGKQSTMKPKRGRPGKIDQQEILDEIARIRGKDVEVVFAKFADIGASGEFSMNADKTRRVIKVAVNSLDPKSVAWHESLHDFFAMLGTSKAERKLKEDLLRAAEDPKVVAQLRELLKDHPAALEQIESDREERLAYMYQFWADGAIELRASERNIFQKLMKMFRDLVGVLSNDEKIDKLFDALHSGRFVEPNLVTAVLADLKANTLGDKLRAVSGPIGDTAAAMFTGATDRLRDTNIDALAELADLFHREPGREVHNTANKGAKPSFVSSVDSIGRKAAEARLAAGEDAEKVFADTKWFRDTNGRMVREVDDSRLFKAAWEAVKGAVTSNADLLKVLDAVLDGKVDRLGTLSLKDVLEAMGLPHMAAKVGDVQIELSSGEESHILHSKDKITAVQIGLAQAFAGNFSKLSAEDRKNAIANVGALTVLHEVQHVLQVLDGRADGDMFTGEYSEQRGEIEAFDVEARYVARYIAEKLGGEEPSLPELAKKAPSMVDMEHSDFAANVTQPMFTKRHSARRTYGGSGVTQELPFLQRRSQSLGRYRNRLDNILADTTAEERQQALENFQSMKAPSSELEREIATFLGDMHAYLIRNDVRRLDSGSRRWVPISKVDKYFPRVWDKNTIRNNEAGFISLLEKYVGKAQARNTFEAIVGGDGSLELKENEHSLGYSPWMAAVNDRQFTFINESNAAEFAKFQSKDLMDTLVSYTQSAVHRAEHSRSFGYDSGKIQSLLAEASKQGASSEELIMASKAVLALEGTLGHDFNPRLKEVMSGIQTVENVVLLPLALFTNLVDPIGVAIRSNDMGEAWNAFKYGIKGVVDAMLRNGEDAETEMAKLIGIIDNQNMLDAMGHVYNSMNMSPFLKRVNDKFFKYNGMEMWNQRMRVAAMGAAQRFIVKNLDNKRYMDELGITEKDVFQLADGTIALTKDQLLQAGAANSKVEEIEKRIQSAVFKWVDGAVLRPNAAHRPIWGSDPRFQLIFHLKQFTFSFHNTIIKRVQSEVRHGNSKPAWILMSYIPFMFLSDVAKGSLLGTVNTMGDLANVAAGSVARSGILGTGTFGLDAVGDLTRDKVPGTSFMGPTFDHAMTILTGILGSTTSGQVLDRSVPFVKYL